MSSLFLQVAPRVRIFSPSEPISHYNITSVVTQPRTVRQPLPQSYRRGLLPRGGHGGDDGRLPGPRRDRPGPRHRPGVRSQGPGCPEPAAQGRQDARGQQMKPFFYVVYLFPHKVGNL